MSLAKKFLKIPVRGPEFFSYLYHQKWRFGITNTKFDISFTVFRESFLGDQYRLRAFAKHLEGVDSLLFVDVGRNHGFVFYYFVHHLAQSGVRIKNLKYIGIDPSPIKFAYYNKLLADTQIDYRLIDKAIVFDGAETVKLKYGEHNIGNFNVTGSNYEARMKKVSSKSEFIEIEVETLQVNDLLKLVKAGTGYDGVIVKVDCKNRNEIIMERSMASLKDHPGPWLVACEPDSSAEGRLQAGGALETSGALVVSNKDL